MKVEALHLKSNVATQELKSLDRWCSRPRRLLGCAMHCYEQDEWDSETPLEEPAI
jgi:hypothetical protein